MNTPIKGVILVSHELGIKDKDAKIVKRIPLSQIRRLTMRGAA